MELLNPVDLHVGSRVRSTRVFRDLELWELATATGIAVSDLVSCEAAHMRFAPEHLAAIATTLQVPSSFFFERIHKSVPRAKSPVSFGPTVFRVGANDNVLGPHAHQALCRSSTPAFSAE